MPRKKKKEEEEENESGWEEVLGGDAKRSIAAIILVMFGALFLFGFFHAAGPFGELLDRGIGSLFGWGKWLFPVLLFVAALFLLRRRETTLSDIVKFIGLGVVFVGLLGFFHLFLDNDPEELLKLAKNGKGGGYIGYMISYILLRFTGRGAGAVILGALFLSGMVAAFNVSLVHFLSRIKRGLLSIGRKKAKPNIEEGDEDDDEDNDEEQDDDDASEEGTDDASAEEGTGDDEENEDKDEEDVPDDKLEAHNIAGLRFTEDDAGDEEPDDEEDDEEADGDEDDDTDEDGEDDEDDEEDDDEDRSRKRRRKRLKWEMPSLDFFRSHTEKGASGDIEGTKRIIQETLKYFNISGEMGEAVVGPTVTQYTFRPAFGTRLSKIVSLSNDLALALARHPIRIEAPIPNTSLVGIEVPNAKQADVRMRNILESKSFVKKSQQSRLSVVLGEAVDGSFEIADLESMPHLLVAGRTGSGKSVCVNSILLSLLYQNSPEDLQLILVDPKRVELSLYNKIPHLKSGKVITDAKHVVNALKYAVHEMERRLKIFESVHARNLAAYREKYERGERMKVIEDGKARRKDLEPIPHIVIVIDEMADLMMSHGKEVEATIVRLAQMSRAVGIHLVLATQKPVSDVVTGLIKSNVPAKIAFSVSSQMDSRIILDTGGAEKLVGKGDMLYAAPGASRPKRLQGVFVDDREVKDVVRFLIEQKEELGAEEIGGDFDGDDDEETESASGFSDDVDFSNLEEDPSEQDELYDEAKKVVIESGRAATTYLQRRLSVGYGRAAKLLDMLEEHGVVGPAEGRNKGRVVLVGKAAGEAGDAEYDDPMRDQAARDKWQT
jgi:S-DNA-T family DNA segregation ATPase FtsK/SpoIIIE